MSHHSATKPLVREVARSLPSHIASWIDEHEILAGDDLRTTLRDAVTSSVDYVVAFLDQRSASSEWVQRELEWARSEEERLTRTFVLPVVLDTDALRSVPWAADRLHIACHGFSERHVQELAGELTATLFALLSRDLAILRKSPSDASGKLKYADRSDDMLRDVAKRVRRFVFPYRRGRALRLRTLLDLLRDDGVEVASIDELHQLLFRLRERKLLAGIGVTSASIFVGEEHLNWRYEEAVAAKRIAAEHVADSIPDGCHVYLDAGSSTLEVARSIARGIRLGQWQRLSVTTCAVPVAQVFSDLANDLGLDDSDARLSLVVLGGRMRLNTAALIWDLTPGQQDAYDLAVVGTNGVTVEYGLTTTTPDEAVRKAHVIESAKRVYAMAEPAKYGVWQSETFADPTSDIEVVTACTPEERTRISAILPESTDTGLRPTFIEREPEMSQSSA